ncbi:MAG: hypothetical protein KAG84_07385 [Bacteroidales bacterium]|nr:hypothetical protein [Bacteroidales bacterium]
MKIRNIYISSFLIILLLIFGSSCSTKKNKWNRRAFHNVTAHYNAYFNGEQALKEAKKNIEENHIDDYTEVLDVFPLGTTESIMSASSNLDRSITKASLVIHKHSMYFRKKEEVKWVYYSYLMMGKAKFYKQEYGTSKQILGYIMTRYPKEKVKQEAIMWIAFNESVEGNYSNAISQLDGIRAKVNNGEVSKDAYRMLPRIYADIYVRLGNYKSAIPHIRVAIERAKSKDRARLFYILAQLEQNLGKFKDATKHYLQVLKKNPTYKMDFNARISMANSFDGGDSKEVMKQLRKMLKDIKNVEYQDQIYFVMAKVALKNKNKDEAIGYLKLSVQQSVSNNKQKAFSAMKLAEIYFEDQQYQNSQAYYDSTMLFLPKEYPDYDKLKYRKDVLTELVQNLVIIQTEDSLQALANMSQRKRNKLIDSWIAAEVEAEKLKQKQEQERQEQLQFMAENERSDPRQMRSVTDKGGTKWYFYNPVSLTTGKSSFMAKWGRRKLADNWRISVKESMDFESSDDDDDAQGSDTTNSTTDKVSTNPKSRGYYMQNIPFTEQEIDSSNAKIEIALFNAGSIYKEKLLNNPKAIETFDELFRRFPEGKNTAHAYYDMYRMYHIDGNNSDARFYKNKLVKEYPDSEYAKMLTDPNYFKKMQEDADKVKVYYKTTYALYLSNKYSAVKENCAKAKVDFPDNKIELSKFEMLNAMSVGHTSDTASFILALEVVVNDYPNSDVKIRAEEMIALLKIEARKDEGGESDQGEDATKGEESSESELIGSDGKPSIFIYEPEATHMFLVLADKRNVKIGELKNRISDHNSKYFGTKNLTVSAIPINKDVLLVGVSNFTNEEKALKYFKTTKRNSLLYSLLKKNGGNYFIISEGNYSKLYKSKDLDGYLKFYKRYYPNSK